MQKHTINKAMLVFALCALLGFAALSAVAADLSTVRVKLSNANDGTLNIGVKGTYTLKENGCAISEDVIIATSGSKLSVTGKNSGKSYYSGSAATFVRTENSAGNVFKLYTTANGNRYYLGDLYVKRTDAGFQAVNHVPIEQYLYGVVAYEMSNDFPMEALKAQAVCARNYVISKMKGKGDYDVVDTPKDQVYKGFSSTNKNAMAAVDATSNQVLKYNGELIIAYYTASNGGQTELAGNPWSYDYPYITMKDDPYDTRNPESLSQKLLFPTSVSSATPLDPRAEQFLKDKVAVKLGDMGYSTYSDQIQITGVTRLEANSPKYESPSRCYTRATATVKVNAVKATGETPRLEVYVGAKPEEPKLKNLLDNSGNPIVTSEGPVFIDGGGSVITYTQYTAIMQQYEAALREWENGAVGAADSSGLGMSGQIDSLSVDIDFVIYDIKSKSLPYRAFTNDSLTMYYTEQTNGGTYLVNCRYGHGVGMSQRGAEQMANEGRIYTDILNFYYEGVALSTVNYSSEALQSADTGSAVPITDYQPDTGDGGLIEINDVTGTGVYLDASKIFGQAKAETQLYADKTMKQKSGVIPAGYVMEIRSKAKNGTIYNVTYNGKKGAVYSKYVKILARGAEHPSAEQLAENQIADSAEIAPTVASEAPTTEEALQEATVVVQAGNAYAMKLQITGEVKGSSVVIRSMPSTGASKIGLIYSGTAVRVVGQTNDFYAVVTTGGVAGYVAKDYLTVNQPPVGTVKSTTLNVRESPSTSAAVVDVIKKGALVPIHAQNGGFYKITTPYGVTGYVSSEYMSAAPAAIPKISSDSYAKYSSEPEASGSSSSSSSSSSSGSAATGKPVATAYIKDEVNFRSGPSTGSEKLGMLDKGTKIYIYAQKNNFYRVSANDKMGYVSKDYVKNIKAVAASAQVSSKLGITSDRVKARTESGTVLYTVPKNEVVEIIGSSGSKYKVKYNGTLGYIDDDYVSVRSIDTKTAKEDVRMRKEASIESAALLTVSAGEKVYYLSKSGEWSKCFYGGKNGYIKTEFLE